MIDDQRREALIEALDAIDADPDLTRIWRKVLRWSVDPDVGLDAEMQEFARGFVQRLERAQRRRRSNVNR